MGKFLLYFILLILFISSCQSPRKGAYGGRHKSKKSYSPTGKYRNPTIFSRVNPFQGRAKWRLAKSKRKKFKLFKRKRHNSGTRRKGKKPGSSFNMKRRVDRRRIKSSGSRSQPNSKGRKKKKDLFNTRKK